MKSLNLRLLIPVTLSLGLIMSGCSNEPGEPTKEAAVSLLKEFCDNLLESERRAAADLMHTPPGMSETDKMTSVGKFLDLQEISLSGIDILAEKGTWGKFKDVWPERGEAIANKWSVNIDNCWALLYEEAEAGFFWNGENFLIIRCDDIGKLQ